MLALCSALLAFAAPAAARDRQPSEDALVIPPAPSKAAPRIAVEVHSGFTVPLDNSSLCPSGFGCVLRSGGGIGGSGEYRWPRGLGVMLGYDAWFLDSDSVYELGVQQVLHGGARYTMPTDIVFHPLFELSGGLMGYGDTFRVATIGGTIQGFVGADVELTESLGVRFGVGVRGFSHTKFRTERDKVLRGTTGGLVEALFVQVGLSIM